MPVEEKDFDKLKELQDIDNALEEGAKTFNDSPIAKEIEAVRAKKAEYKTKRDQIDAVFVKARAEVETVSAKDSELAAAQEKTQKEIEETQGDYRKVEAHTNKLNELTNQRKIVDEKIETIEANFNKIKELKEKVEGAIGKISMQEDDLNKKLEETNVQLKLDMEKAQEKKIQLEKEISAEALEAYKKSRSIVGKIVIGTLQGDSCSVCKATLSNAGLSKVHEEAPLSTCPTCKRLLWIS